MAGSCRVCRMAIAHLRHVLQGNVKWHEGVQSKVKKWTLGIFLLSLAASLFWVFKVTPLSRAQACCCGEAGRVQVGTAC